jgi:hypothetical protein
MDTRKFVDLLRIVVRDAAVSGELNVLRRPSDDLQERSKWYHSLSDDQKTILSSIILDVADRAIFGFLCVLDGVRAIEDDGDKGHLELRYVGGHSTLLNPPEGEMLHELW